MALAEPTAPVHRDTPPLSAKLAAYDGRCGLCRTAIIHGVELIVPLDHEWVHVNCAVGAGHHVAGFH